MQQSLSLPQDKWHVTLSKESHDSDRWMFENPVIVSPGHICCYITFQLNFGGYISEMFYLPSKTNLYDAIQSAFPRTERHLLEKFGQDYLKIFPQLFSFNFYTYSTWFGEMDITPQNWKGLTIAIVAQQEDSLHYPDNHSGVCMFIAQRHRTEQYISTRPVAF